MDLASRRIGARARALGGGEEQKGPRAAGSPAAPRGRRFVAAVCLALVGLCASALGGASDPRDSLIDVGASAYRAFGGVSQAPMDYATDDPRALTRWLTPRFLPAPYAGSLEIPGWRLLGARMVSGVVAAAAMVAYVNAAGERAGLLIEPLDAPPNLPPGARQIGPVVVASETLGGSGVTAIGPSVGFVAAVMRVWDPAVAGPKADRGARL
jgi:anti-sigma factor RsiW